MKAADIMTKEVITVGSETPIREVAALMLERHISGVPVVDEAQRVLGVVSEGDLIKRPEIETDRIRRGWLGLFVSNEERMHDFVKSHGRKAREVMTQPAISVALDTPLAEIVRLMEKNRVKRLPVVEQGKLAGLVTRTDLLRALVAKQADAPAVADDKALRGKIESMLNAEGWTSSAFVNVEVENGVARLWGTVETPAQREAIIVAVRSVPGIRDVEARLGKSMEA